MRLPIFPFQIALSLVGAFVAMHSWAINPIFGGGGGLSGGLSPMGVIMKRFPIHLVPRGWVSEDTVFWLYAETIARLALVLVVWLVCLNFIIRRRSKKAAPKPAAATSRIDVTCSI
jgi:hypothetical protein